MTAQAHSPAALTGLLTLTIDDLVRTRNLPRQSTVTLGRGRLNGLEVQDASVPRDLVTFRPVEDGWVALNGPRSRVRLGGLWVEPGARFEPKARILLTEGIWTLDWDELDAPCRVEVDVHPTRLGEQLPPYVLDARISPDAKFRGTLFTVYGIELDDLTKHRLGVVFKHLLDQKPPPANLYVKRAAELSMKPADLKNLVSRVRQRVNRERRQDLVDADQLGVYLVDVSQLISYRDLTP